MIQADAQLLEAGQVVELFELDATSIGGDHLHFHGYQDVGMIVWQGKEYNAWPMVASDFARTSAQQPAPTLAVGNVEGSISAMCIYFADMVGARLTRHTTLGNYLDAVNFAYGNPSADSSQEFPLDIWTIEQKISETSEVVEFELSSALNFQGVQLPRRQIVANVCTWLSTGGYRGSYCGYTGSAMFDKDGNPVESSGLDRCGGKLSDCKKRFGEFDVLNYGSFPAAGMLS